MNTKQFRREFIGQAYDIKTGKPVGRREATASQYKLARAAMEAQLPENQYIGAIWPVKAPAMTESYTPGRMARKTEIQEA